MKHRGIKVLTACLALLSAAALLLAGCTPAALPDGTSAVPSADTSAEITEAAAEPFLLTSGGKTVCTVIRPIDASDDVVAQAIKLREKLEKATGIKVGIGNDFVKPGTGHNAETYEILVGETSYGETAEVMEELRYNDYAVAVKGRKIVVTAGHEAILSKAVSWFLSTGIEGLEKNESGDFTLKFDDYRFAAAYSMDSLSILGVPLNRYRIVYGKNGNVGQIGAEAVAEVFAQLTGYMLKTVPDTAAAEEYEILVGSTNRLEKMTSSISKFAVYMSGKKPVIDCCGPVTAEGAVRRMYSDKMRGQKDYDIGADFSLSGYASADLPIERAEGTDIRVMSYNILCEKWGGTVTAPRAELLGTMLDAYSPDVVGIQEVDSIWCKYIPMYCIGYRHICTVRPDGGENYSTILYKEDKYDLVASGVVPYSMSANLFCRNMGWAILSDKATGSKIGIISTHWDFDNAENDRSVYRRVQAEEMALKVAELAKKYECPVFTTGDYNCRHDSTSMNYFRSINNMWCFKFDSVKLVNNYGSASTLGTLPGSGGGVIDFVFGTKDTQALASFVVVNFDTKDISDHQPVVSDIKFGAKAG